MKRAREEVNSPHIIKLGDVTPHLVCHLCGGYYIDATTITECMHSFCKSCLLKYLQRHRYCPTCDVQVYRQHPLENLRNDELLQDIVYKIVPGLFKNEMQARKDFYRTHGGTPLTLEDGGDDTSDMYTPDDAVSLSFSYFCIPPNPADRRYFSCPAAVKILHLAKLLHSKYGFGNAQRIDILFLRDVLNPNLTLMEVMHVYGWRRRGPLPLFYRIIEPDQEEQISSDEMEGASGDCVPPSVETADSLADSNLLSSITEIGVEEATTPETVANKVSENQTSEESVARRKPQDNPVEQSNQNSGDREWKEIQLQISESGVMSFVNVSRGNDVNETAIGPREITSLNAGSFPCIEDITVDNSSLSVLTNGGQLTKGNFHERSAQSLLNRISSSTVDDSGNSSTQSMSSAACERIEQERKRRCISGIGEISEQTVENKKKNPAYSAKSCGIPVEPSPSSSTEKRVGKTLPVQATSTCEKIALPQAENKSCNVQKAETANEKHDTKSKLEKTVSLPSTSRVGNNFATNSLKDNRTATKIASVRPSGTRQARYDAHSVSSSAGVRSYMPKHSDKVMPRSYSTLNDTHFPPKNSKSKREPPKMAIVAPTPSSTRANVTNRNYLASYTAGNNGISTLRIPPLGWDPTLRSTNYPTRISLDTQQVAINALIPPRKLPTIPGYMGPLAPPRFYRMRNMPRFLGNPASGVKPMYQVASAFGENSQSPEPSYGQRPLQTGRNYFSSLANGSPSAEIPSQSPRTRVATVTSSGAASGSSSNLPTSSSAGMFQTPTNSSTVTTNANFNFNAVSSNYVSFADLCKTNAASSSRSHNASTHLGENSLASAHQTLSKLFDLQPSSPAVSQADSSSAESSPAQTATSSGAFHTLPPSADLIFKPQLRQHSSGGSRYQCTTPAVQHVPATSSHMRNGNQTSNASSKPAGQKTEVAPSPVPQAKASTSNGDTSREPKRDVPSRNKKS